MKFLVLLLLFMLPLAHAVSYSTLAVELNELTVLAQEDLAAVVIIYSASDEGAEAAFIGTTTFVEDGAQLPTGDILIVEFDAAGLSQIRAGGKPERNAWADFPVRGNTAGHNITQRVYSTAEGYEAIFTPSLPFSLAGKRVSLEYANGWWYMGEMDAANGSVMLYTEGAYGSITLEDELAYGEVGISFVAMENGQALVRFRAGNRKTTMEVTELNDAQAQHLVLWVDYNSSEGIVPDATCYLEGDIRGSLSFINGRYKAQLDYSDLPKRTYSYAISCSKDGFEPALQPRTLDISEPEPPPAPEVVAPLPESGEVTGTEPYLPPAQENSLWDMLTELLSNAFSWLR